MAHSPPNTLLLIRSRVTLEDLKDIDVAFVEGLRALGRVQSSEEWALACSDLRFTVQGFDGWPIDLVAGGRDVAVSFERRDDYCRLAAKFRLEQGATQCDAMLRGMSTQGACLAFTPKSKERVINIFSEQLIVVPRSLLSLFSWEELEVIVCGPSRVDLDLLRRCTIYGEGVTPDHPVVNMYALPTPCLLLSCNLLSLTITFFKTAFGKSSKVSLRRKSNATFVLSGAERVCR